MKRMTLFVLAFIILSTLSLSACTPIALPPYAKDGHLLTENRVSALEYSLYTNKQVQIFVSAIHVRQMALTAGKTDGEQEAAETACREMSEALNEFKQVNPALGMDDMKADTVEIMERSVKHMEEYQDALAEGSDTEFLKDLFSGDILDLTSMTELYNQ